MDLGLVRQLVPPAIVGAILGVVTVNRLPAAPCRLALAAVLVLAGVRLLARRAATATGGAPPHYS